MKNKKSEITNDVICYGLNTKGNGDVFLSKELHPTLSTGGGQAGQGYPCILVKANYSKFKTKP